MLALSMRPRTVWRGVLAGLAFVAAGVQAAGAESLLEAMAAAIGPAGARRAITGLATRADCTGPRGAFTTEIVSHGDVVRFVQVRDSGRTALLVTATAAFARPADGAPMQATTGPEAAFVRGHDLHRLLLDLEARVQVTTEDPATGCVEGTTAAGRIRLCRRAGLSAPSHMTLTSPGAQTPVVIEFSDWRRLHGVTLPFAIDYLQAGGRYIHRFVAVTPITLPPAITLPADPGAAFDRLGDLAASAGR